MDYLIFDGDLPMGDSKDTTMVFAQDFRIEQCVTQSARLSLECQGVEILGPADKRELFSHLVFIDHAFVGHLSSDRGEFTRLPALEAGVHRISVHVSTYPGYSLCDDFRLKRITLSCL